MRFARICSWGLCFAAMCAGASLLAQPGQADLSEALRTGDVGEVVRSFGPELDARLRRLGSSAGVEPSTATRVVPVLDAVTKRPLGGAQISGPVEDIEAARVVWATTENDLTRFRVRTGTGAEGRDLGPQVGVVGLVTMSQD